MDPSPQEVFRFFPYVFCFVFIFNLDQLVLNYIIIFLLFFFQCKFECVFFILTSIGREIEAKLPNKMSLLWNTLRDIFLEKKGAIAIKKTLLQLIELRACNWKLPVSLSFST